MRNRTRAVLDLAELFADRANAAEDAGLYSAADLWRTARYDVLTLTPGVTV